MIILPKWINDNTYNKLLQSKLLIKYIEPNGKHTYMSKPINCMFFLSKSTKNIELIDESKIIEIWNTIPNEIGESTLNDFIF